MIQVKENKRDQFSIEFKKQFLTRKKLKESNFHINIWIFFPNSIDINRVSFSKEQLYNDLKSTLRLITPIYLLSDIIGEYNSPIQKIRGKYHLII